MSEDIDWAEYTVRVPLGPEYYGTDCSSTRAHLIANDLADFIRSEFAGIEVEYWDGCRGSARTTGPNEDVIERIDRWIQDNWTKVL